MAGVKYGLSSQEPSYQDKSLIFVKLTDSAFRAIEEHLKNAAKSSAAPSIQFLGNEGHLTIPSPGGQARFNFSIDSNEDTQGSFECVQTTGQRSLAALGALSLKMRIQAKEDVYEATRHRVAAAEEQQKKNCTQVIKQSDLGKSKIRRSTKWEEHRNERIAAASAAAQNGPGGRREYSRTRPPASNPARENNLLGISKSSSPNNSYQRSNLHNKSQSTPDVSKRPLKERLIHMLALRPYKKPELLDRAVRDGLKSSTSPQFWMTVNSVATFKTNVYQLKREMWAEVQEEWPFYSEQERALLKRRKPQNLTPPGNSDGGSSVSSGQSPTSTHPGSPPSVVSGISNNKRPGYFESIDGFQTKRQRISHYVKPEPPQSNSSSLFSSGLPSLDIDSECPTRSSNSPTRVERVPRPDRTDRTDWPDRSDWTDRLDRQDRDQAERSDRPSQMDWNERNDWNDRERTERNDRGYRMDRPERFDRSERKDWNERSEYRRGYDNCDQENQFQIKTDSSFKRNSDNSAKEKLFAQKSESVNDSASRDTKVNGLSLASDRGRSFNSSSDRDRDRLSTSSMLLPKDRLSPLPRPRTLRDSFHSSEHSDSRSNSKQAPSSDSRNSTVSRRPGEDSRDGRDGRDRVLSQMSSSRAQGAHHDNFDKNQSSANSRLSAGHDQPSSDHASQYTYPEFLKEYTKIENGEQRRQYKADFNKDYREYQTLHQMVERVSQHFAQLEKRLRQEREGSDGYKRIKEQIVQEYYANKKDAKLNESKKRFQYLHDKLSHIKKLVADYDSTTQKGNADS